MSHGRVPELAERLSALSTTWLPPTLVRSVSPRDALSEVQERWPEDWDDIEPAGSPLLFPFPYSGRVQVSPALFHQLVDAACEAQRAAAEVVLVAVPTARSGPQPDSSDMIKVIAQRFGDAGFAVSSAGDICDLGGIGTRVIRNVCASGPSLK